MATMKLEAKTELWQEQRGKSWYRIQTTDSAVKRKLARRKGWNLAGEGINCNLWIYRGKIEHSRNAQRMLRALTG